MWEDVRKPQGVHDAKHGPLGTTDRYEKGKGNKRCRRSFSKHRFSFQIYRIALDDDLPAQGQHYCTPCAKYFVTESALSTHEKTKPHKRRCKALLGAQPHNQVDADWAGGMGAADNGQVTKMAMDA